MQVLISEFCQAEMTKIISKGTFGFEAVGGFLVSSLPPKKKRAKTFRCSRVIRNEMTEKEREYIKLKLIGVIDSKSELLKKYKMKLEELEKKTIKTFIREKLDLTVAEYEKIEKKYNADIRKVKSLFKNTRTKNMSIYEFYDWYIKKEKKCCYCGIEENDLKIYFNKENEQYVEARQRGKVLELERIETVKEQNIYTLKNIELACYICNNAKSDFLSAKDFKNIAKGINLFWNEKLNDKNVFFDEKSQIWK